MNNLTERASMAQGFVGRRGLLVTFGPKIVGCTVLSCACDAKGMQARIKGDAGEESAFGGSWDVVIFAKDLWQVLYANARVVFDVDAVRKFDTGELLDISEYL